MSEEKPAEVPAEAPAPEGGEPQVLYAQEALSVYI